MNEKTDVHIVHENVYVSFIIHTSRKQKNQLSTLIV